MTNGVNNKSCQLVIYLDTTQRIPRNRMEPESIWTRFSVLGLIIKKVYLSSVKGTKRRGRALVRWKYRVREYVNERGVMGNALDWARRECVDWERWRSICRGHPLEGCSLRERDVRAIDWLMHNFRFGLNIGIPSLKSRPIHRIYRILRFRLQNT